MKKKEIEKKGDDMVELKKQLCIYRALYFREKQKLNTILIELNKYDYLLPDAYRSIIKEIINVEGIHYHE